MQPIVSGSSAVLNGGYGPTLPLTPKSFLEKTRILERHERTVAAVLHRARAAPRDTISVDLNAARGLYDNTDFLNFNYCSDDVCNQAPYSYGGKGMGGCIPDSSGTGAHKLTCSGPQTAINISHWEYQTDDCTGSPISTGTVIQDGSCSTILLDDDGGFLTNIEEEYPPGSYSISCDATRSSSNTLSDVSFYNDNTCDLMTLYSGLNKNRCIPIDEYYAKITEECTLLYYSDNECENEITGDDDFFDDDYEDDDAEMCQAVWDAGDNYIWSGQYILIESHFCSSSAVGDDDDDGDNACFAGSETVLLESGVTKGIADVSVGDAVQVVSVDGSLKFSEVVFLPHGANTHLATFTELKTASGNSLRATPSHLVLAGACGADAFQLTAIQDIAEGSCVQTAGGEDEVTGSERVLDRGIYTMVTKEPSGLVVVNGVRASSFAHNHWLVNNYYNIHRNLYEVAPLLLQNRDMIAANLIVGDVAAILSQSL
jgi:hypothetical protein